MQGLMKFSGMHIINLTSETYFFNAFKIIYAYIYLFIPGLVVTPRTLEIKKLYQFFSFWGHFNLNNIRTLRLQK